MAIVKAKQKRLYTEVPNETARDKNLSLEAKGLLTILLSMSEDWTIYKKQITDFSTNAYHSTNRAFNELIENGYIVDEGRQRDDKGLLKENLYIVYQTPQIKPSGENQDLDNPNQDNQHLRSITNSNTKNKEEENIYARSFEEKKTKPKKVKTGFVKPTLQEVKDYFKQKNYKEETAVRAFEYYEAGEWKDGKGNKVINWKQKMLSVWMKEENKIVEQNEQGRIIF